MKMDAWKSISISIHTLHTEGDPNKTGSKTASKKFQSTPSTRRVTIGYQTYGVAQRISIHTLHTEGDLKINFYHPQSDISIHTLHTAGDT